ncbi:MAG: aminopeptidase P family protein [Pseudonocardiaceae bacterium]
MTDWNDASLAAILEGSPVAGAYSLDYVRAMTQGWSLPSGNGAEWVGASPRRRRRRLVAEDFSGEVLVIPVGRPVLRTNDLNFPFRPASDHMWLVGDTEPGSVLVLGPDGDETLFAVDHLPLGHPLSFLEPHGALWEGPRDSLGALATRLGIRTRPLDELEERLRGARARTVRGIDPRVDTLVQDDGRELETQLARRRLHKDAYEVEQLRHVADVAVAGFEAVARVLGDVADQGEALVEGVFTKVARARGRGLASIPIVGGGPRATIPHWQRNDERVGPEELVLLDAGVEGPELYTSDVARTMPVSGHFTTAQRDVHDIVHAAHEAALAATKPGAPFLEPHRAAQVVLLDGLSSLGVLPNPAFDELVVGERGRRWTLHTTSHMLGIDVHDCMPLVKEYMSGDLEPGHVLTVEPGLYFSPYDDHVPQELRGIGVRIEDDLVVTNDGIEVLTAALPTSSAGVEAWISDCAG